MRRTDRRTLYVYDCPVVEMLSYVNGRTAGSCDVLAYLRHKGQVVPHVPGVFKSIYFLPQNVERLKMYTIEFGIRTVCAQNRYDTIYYLTPSFSLWKYVWGWIMFGKKIRLIII